MDFKKILHALPAFLLACVLFLTGCQTSIEGSQTDIKQTEINTDSVSEDETEEEPEIYADRLWDRSLTEGKLAVYAMRTSNDYTSDSLVSHAGDSQLIITPDGKTMLIDINTPTNASIVVATLQKLGIKKLDYFVLSHTHIDHIGGCPILFRYIEIGEMITNDHFNTGNGTYRDVQKLIERYNIPVTHRYEGDVLELGKYVQIKFYNPPRDFDYSGGTAQQNNGSLLMKMTYKDSSFLFGGDLYASQEDVVLEKYADELQTSVVKMNHHGYGSSNTKAWVKTVSAKIAYGQMTDVVSDVVLGRYQASGSTIFHTGLDGPFVIYTDGDDTYEVQVARDRWIETFGQNDMENGYMVVE